MQLDEAMQFLAPHVGMCPSCGKDTTKSDGTCWDCALEIHDGIVTQMKRSPSPA